MKWSPFVGIHHNECFASDSTWCALQGIRCWCSFSYQVDPGSLTRLPSIVMVRSWWLSFQIVIDLYFGPDSCISSALGGLNKLSRSLRKLISSLEHSGIWLYSLHPRLGKWTSYLSDWLSLISVGADRLHRRVSMGTWHTTLSRLHILSILLPVNEYVRWVSFMHICGSMSHSVTPVMMLCRDFSTQCLIYGMGQWCKRSNWAHIPIIALSLLFDCAYQWVWQHFDVTHT